jgi:hypothetical protein
MVDKNYRVFGIARALCLDLKDCKIRVMDGICGGL